MDPPPRSRQIDPAPNGNGLGHYMKSYMRYILSFTIIVILCQLLMYGSNRSFNISPQAPPRAFDFFENYCSNSPPTWAKMPFKCPTLGSIQVIKCPTPGTFHRHKNDRRTAEMPSVVEQNLYKNNKN